MTIEKQLRAMAAVDDAPEMADLGGEAEFVVAIAELPEDLVSRAADAVWQAWPEIGDHRAALAALASRLPDVTSALEYADVADGLVAGVAALDDDTSAVAVATALAAALCPEALDERPLHGGHAVRAAADLASVSSVSSHTTLAALSTLAAIPDPAGAPFARAIGRFLDLADEPWLRSMLRDQVLPLASAAADAAIELGHVALREAFANGDPVEATDVLGRAAELFEEAARADEDRPDALGFAAATRCALAFAAHDVEAMERWAAELDKCRIALMAWSPSDDGPSRAEAAAGAWVLLTGDLLALRRHLDAPDTLRLLNAVEVIADAYYGVRLRVLESERLGLQAFLRPLVIEKLRADGLLRDGLTRLAGEDEATAARRAAATQLLSEAGPGPKARRQRAARPAPPGHPGVVGAPDPMRVLRVNELAAEASQLADAAGTAAGPAFAELTGLLAHFVRKSLDRPPPYQREDGDGDRAMEAQLQDDLWDYLNYTALSTRTGAYEPQKRSEGAVGPTSPCPSSTSGW